MCKKSDDIRNGFTHDEKKFILLKYCDDIIENGLSKKQIVGKIQELRERIDRWFD